MARGSCKPCRPFWSRLSRKRLGKVLFLLLYPKEDTIQLLLVHSDFHFVSLRSSGFSLLFDLANIEPKQLQVGSPCGRLIFAYVCRSSPTGIPAVLFMFPSLFFRHLTGVQWRLDFLLESSSVSYRFLAIFFYFRLLGSCWYSSSVPYWYSSSDSDPRLSIKFLQSSSSFR